MHVSTAIKGMLKINSFKKEKNFVSNQEEVMRTIFYTSEIEIRTSNGYTSLMIIRLDRTQLTSRLNEV